MNNFTREGTENRGGGTESIITRREKSGKRKAQEETETPTEPRKRKKGLFQPSIRRFFSARPFGSQYLQQTKTPVTTEAPAQQQLTHAQGAGNHDEEHEILPRERKETEQLDTGREQGEVGQEVHDLEQHVGAPAAADHGEPQAGHEVTGEKAQEQEAAQEEEAQGDGIQAAVSPQATTQDFRIWAAQLCRDIAFALEPNDGAERRIRLETLPDVTRAAIQETTLATFFQGQETNSMAMDHEGQGEAGQEQRGPPSPEIDLDQSNAQEVETPPVDELSPAEVLDPQLSDSSSASSSRQRPAKRPRIPGKTKEEKAAAFEVPFGEMAQHKLEGVARLCFLNIGPGGLQPEDSGAVAGLRTFLQQWEVDHFGACEVQVNWSNAPPHHRLPELFRSENMLRCIASHNSNENDHGRWQQGGTMAMTMGEMAARMHSQGKDLRAWDGGYGSRSAEKTGWRHASIQHTGHAAPNQANYERYLPNSNDISGPRPAETSQGIQWRHLRRTWRRN
jgi:hypothetical protein